jgi:hypothetical protein
MLRLEVVEVRMSVMALHPPGLAGAKQDYLHTPSLDPPVGVLTASDRASMAGFWDWVRVSCRSVRVFHFGALVSRWGLMVRSRGSVACVTRSPDLGKAQALAGPSAFGLVFLNGIVAALLGQDRWCGR